MNTVKVIIPTAILTASIVVSGVFTLRSLDSTSRKIEGHITQVVNAASGNDWGKAEKQLIQIENDWRKAESGWAVVLDHTEIDNIDTSLSRLTNFVRSKDKALSLGEAALLEQYVRHIPEKEKFTLRNIL